jgi:NADPH:quinone reductase-like Zn-dependent oxidoreductase
MPSKGVTFAGRSGPKERTTMKLRYRILSIFAIVVALAFVSLAVALSYNSPCGAGAALPAGSASMKGVVNNCYGSPDVLKLAELPKPTPADDQLLVKVHAAALNPLDWHMMRGSPYIMRMSSGFGAPKDSRIGVDFAGTVEAVGKNVTQFKPGDEVFGGADGAVAEYVVVRESRAVALKPTNMSFEQAASVPVAAITALQGLRDKGGIKPGQKVLINGASGGVGTFAVQIAKHFGAEVTGVCSTRNVELVRSLGADRVVDYTHEDFATGPERYDIILDNVGNRSIADLRRVMQPKGTLVIVGGPKGDWIGPMMGVIKAAIVAPFVDQKLGFFIARLNHEDMKFLGELMQAGQLTPVIDRHYPLPEAAKAMAYLEEGRARGKVIVSME